MCNHPKVEQTLIRHQQISNLISQHKSVEHFHKKQQEMKTSRDGGRGGEKRQRGSYILIICLCLDQALSFSETLFRIPADIISQTGDH